MHIAVLAGDICTNITQNLSIILEKILLENYVKCELMTKTHSKSTRQFDKHTSKQSIRHISGNSIRHTT